MRNPGRLLTQRWLLQQVWGPQYGSETVVPPRLPGRACAASSNPTRHQPRYFITEPGMGYRFEPGDDPQANDSSR